MAITAASFSEVGFALAFPYILLTLSQVSCILIELPKTLRILTLRFIGRDEDLHSALIEWLERLSSMDIGTVYPDLKNVNVVYNTRAPCIGEHWLSQEHCWIDDVKEALRKQGVQFEARSC